MSATVPDAVINRLPAYYRHLQALEEEGVENVSSQTLGERMHQTPSQIRQDINFIGGVGRQGYGYNVAMLRQHLMRILGLEGNHDMIVLGAGSIGTALARYPGFAADGFIIRALFDTDSEKTGGEICGIPVLNVGELDRYLAEHRVDIAVMAVPSEAAQGLLHRLEEGGVTAVWNFSPLDLQHSTSQMQVVNVHLGDSLKTLSYRMCHREEH